MVDNVKRDRDWGLGIRDWGLGKKALRTNFTIRLRTKMSSKGQSLLSNESKKLAFWRFAKDKRYIFILRP